PSRAVDDHGARAERRGAREAPIEMHDPADDLLKRAPQAIQWLYYYFFLVPKCFRHWRPVETIVSLFRIIPTYAIKHSASDNEVELETVFRSERAGNSGSRHHQRRRG